MYFFAFFNSLNLSLFLSRFQATCRRQPNPADAGGELRPARSPADPARHFNHAPLCRAQHGGLADPAEAPGCPGAVGGEAPELQPEHWLRAGLSANPSAAFPNQDACISGFPCEVHGCCRQADVHQVSKLPSAYTEILSWGSLVPPSSGYFP